MLTVYKSYHQAGKYRCQKTIYYKI